MVVRGKGAPITSCKTVTLGESEHLPDEREVRHIVTQDAEGPVEWATEPIAQYAHRECVKAGAEAVLPTIEDRFDSPVKNVNTEVQFDDDDDSGARIVVKYTVWTETWERAVKSTPNIDFGDLVAVTPQSVQTTVELVGEKYSCDVPVFIRTTDASLL